MEAIYATDINYGLSKNSIIPWKSKKDMSFFMNKTIYNVVIMGRKTYFSLPEENRPLKNRLNIVLTSNPEQFRYNKECMNDKTIFTDDPNIFVTILKNKKNYKQILNACFYHFSSTNNYKQVLNY
jgi:dihydrofolate reductase